MRAATALGSNLHSPYGDSAANLYEALHRMQDLGDLVATSSFYATDPVGYADQPRFTNAVALLETDLNPLDLLRGLLAIEQSMGRVRAADVPPKGPRIIDLDLLLYTDDAGHSLVLSDPDLVLPHPELHRRRFVLEPLAEIAPTLRHPTLDRTIADLFAEISSDR